MTHTLPMCQVSIYLHVYLGTYVQEYMHSLVVILGNIFKFLNDTLLLYRPTYLKTHMQCKKPLN